MSERHALVIGAGLAGAAVCVALARRGWRLRLLDAAAGPAEGASGLPVGMLSPYITRAATPLSRLSNLGIADARAQLQQLVPQGAGWLSCEVDNRGHAPGRWPAALVRPSALVQAWLTQAAALTPLHTSWNSPVERLRRDSRKGCWQVLGATGQVLAEAPVVVVSAAFGSLALLLDSSLQTDAALPLLPVHGQVSLGALDGTPLAERPQRDNGVFIPAYEDSGLQAHWPRRMWTMGSTYERWLNSCELSKQAHERNADNLQKICPPAAEALRQAMAQGHLLGWAQVRCASLDRLPLVGALPDISALDEHIHKARYQRRRLPLAAVPRWPGLYTLSALGSRGLTLAHWCATQLALLMEGLPADVTRADQDLINFLDPARFALKQAYRASQAAANPQPV